MGIKQGLTSTVILLLLARMEAGAQDNAQQLLSQLTLSEKITLLSFRGPAIPRLGIPSYTWWNEGLHGVARAREATVFPQSIGMAASFDPGLLQLVGDAISTEGRALISFVTPGGGLGRRATAKILFLPE
jgi:beta-glucosidase